MNGRNTIEPATAEEIVQQVQRLLLQAQPWQQNQRQMIATMRLQSQLELGVIWPILRRRWRQVRAPFMATYGQLCKQQPKQLYTLEELSNELASVAPTDMTEGNPERLRASFQAEVQAAFEEVATVTLRLAELRQLQVPDEFSVVLPAEPLPPVRHGLALPDSIAGCQQALAQQLAQEPTAEDLVAVWECQMKTQLQARAREFSDPHRFQAYAWLLRSSLDMLFQEIRGKYQLSEGRGLPDLPVGQGWRLFLELGLSDLTTAAQPGFAEVSQETLVRELRRWIEQTAVAVSRMAEQERTWKQQQESKAQEQQARANRVAERALLQAERERREVGA